MKKHRIQAYYSIPFEASTSAPMSVRLLSVRLLKTPNHLKSMQVDEPQKNNILAMARRRLCAGKFEEAFLRLILIVDEHDEFLIDSEGRVRHRGQSYYITPGNLLRLRSLVLSMPFDN